MPFLALSSPALRLTRLPNLKRFNDGTATRSSDGPHEIAKPSTCASSPTIINLQKMLLGYCPSEPDCNQLGYGPPSEQRPWHFFVHRRGCLYKIKKLNKKVKLKDHIFIRVLYFAQKPHAYAQKNVVAGFVRTGVHAQIGCIVILVRRFSAVLGSTRGSAGRGSAALGGVRQ